MWAAIFFRGTLGLKCFQEKKFYSDVFRKSIFYTEFKKNYIYIYDKKTLETDFFHFIARKSNFISISAQSESPFTFFLKQKFAFIIYNGSLSLKMESLYSGKTSILPSLALLLNPKLVILSFLDVVSRFLHLRKDIMQSTQKSRNTQDKIAPLLKVDIHE